MGDGLQQDRAQTEVDGEILVVDEVAPPSVGSCGRFLEHVLRRHATTEHGIEMTFGQAQEPFPVFLQRLCQKFALFLRLHAASIPHML